MGSGRLQLAAGEWTIFYESLSCILLWMFCLCPFDWIDSQFQKSIASYRAMRLGKIYSYLWLNNWVDKMSIFPHDLLWCMPWYKDNWKMLWLEPILRWYVRYFGKYTPPWYIVCSCLDNLKLPIRLLDCYWKWVHLVTEAIHSPSREKNEGPK